MSVEGQFLHGIKFAHSKIVLVYLVVKSGPKTRNLSLRRMKKLCQLSVDDGCLNHELTQPCEPLF